MIFEPRHHLPAFLLLIHVHHISFNLTSAGLSIFPLLTYYYEQYNLLMVLGN